MPAEGVIKKEHSDIMSEDEFISVIKAASELGINKIRFTGGEPLVKKKYCLIVQEDPRNFRHKRNLHYD